MHSTKPAARLYAEYLERTAPLGAGGRDIALKEALWRQMARKLAAPGHAGRERKNEAPARPRDDRTHR